MAKIFGFVAVIFTLLFGGWMTTRIVADIQFNRHLGGYLALAAASNSVELATDSMTKVVAAMDQNGYTTGFTSVMYTSPTEDVGFWYSNMKAALAELKAVKPDAGYLERSNILLKLHETITAHKGKDADVFSPDGISIYPNNGMFASWGWGSFLLSALFWCLMGIAIAIRND